MASSTTIAIANNNAESVNRLIEKPNTQRKKKVPINATGTAIIGITVERKSCKNTYTTKNTNSRVMTKVKSTSSIEAKRNSVTSCSIVTFMPGGICFWASAKAVFTSSAICVALEPATWLIIPITAGRLLFFIITEYCKPPNSTFATSRKWTVWPLELLEIMILPYSSGVFRRPL